MKYVVYGLGISGLSTSKYLAKNSCDAVATDDNNLPTDSYPLPLVRADEISYDSETVISFAPGIPLYFPKRHKILEIVKNTGADLACDMEIFYRLNSQNRFIGITGTNGKSTTTALTGFVFKELGIESAIGGNIGVPCFDLPIADDKKSFTYIFETSSYQLDLLSATHFKIAALLNITPDHIDRHGSMENYIESKKRIFRNQVKGDFALIDVDNETSKKVFDELKDDKDFQSTLVPISAKEIQKDGLSLINGVLTNNIGGSSSCLELKSEFLCGEHNDKNMAFAFAMAYCSSSQGNIEDKIISAIKKFEGLKHRCQLVGQKDGIKFVNDSKATNAESTENALKAYQDIFWILGGKEKDGGIANLSPYFGKIAKAYLIGDATEAFAKTLEKASVEFEKCGDLENAFKSAYLDAKKSSLTKKALLLSPACASFDQWKNFEQRGDYFCKLVDELSNS